MLKELATYFSYLHQLRLAILLVNDIEELSASVVHCTLYFIYLFFINFMGQEVINSSSDVFHNM